MDISKVEKSIALIMVEAIKYVPGTVVSKTIIKKLTGSINVVAFDTGEGFPEDISPFDKFAQIIDGRAEIIIDRKSNLLETGQAIIIPAHTSHIIKANERFKMVITIIKSGYE